MKSRDTVHADCVIFLRRRQYKATNKTFIACLHNIKKMLQVSSARVSSLWYVGRSSDVRLATMF